MAAARLSVPGVFQGMADALPALARGDDGSSLASSYEAIALLVHAYLAALDFRLYGFDEDKPLSSCESLAPSLPPEWNSGFGSLSFAYKHKQSSMRFVFRIDRMGAKVEIRGLAVGDEKIYRFERTTRQVVDSQKLPVRIPRGEDGEEERSELAARLGELFVSQEVVQGILDDLRVKIVQKLIPYLVKEGYKETRDESADQPAQRSRRPPHAPPPLPPLPRGSPIPRPNIYPDPRYPRPPPVPMGDFPPPRFEDEYEINRPPRGPPFIMPGRPPLNIGHDDLNPPGLGPYDPLRGSFIGGNVPTPSGGGHAGMHPTFDDPLFTGQGRFGPDGQGRGGYDPQAPPGARWDPVGPGGNPRFPGPNSGRGGNGFNPYGSNQFGGFGPGGGDII